MGPPPVLHALDRESNVVSVPMAIILLVLLNLTLLIREVTSICNVICTTDYATSLNCSCSGTMPMSPFQIEAKCKDMDVEVHGNCEINPPYGWCLIKPEHFSSITSIGTICTASVNLTCSQHKIEANDSISWRLEDKVKFHPPFNLRVKNESEDFIIMWETQSIEDEIGLESEVRICKKNDFSQAPNYYSVVDQSRIKIYSSSLQPLTEYMVDIRTIHANIYKGSWSEWSSKAEWRTGSGEETAIRDVSMLPLFTVFPILLVLVCCFLALRYIRTQKPCWFKKLQLLIHIPSPDDFFKPLYQTHNGNFKDWVQPVFSECDFLTPNTPLQMIDQKGQDFSHWKRQMDITDVENEWTRNQGSHSHLSSSSLLYFQEQSGNNTGHSLGLLSIHTVLFPEDESSTETNGGTVCGGSRERAESEEKESDKKDETFGLLAKAAKPSDMVWQPPGHINESERSSLDSFNSNEQSEDDYPPVDLDTIDSGFGESDCSSPLNPDIHAEDQKAASVFRGECSSSSNYVKQWMICTVSQEDSTN